ncbi:unnamed protein product [Leptosia nina]|uniref:Peptidase S1 domain-containing protein n=1 Tax=Leptosia nina TaxID=320188 RepID=A0AAV1IX56_9NEOP
MKLFLIIISVCIVVAKRSFDIERQVTNYHGEVGIPEAARIRTAEAVMVSSASTFVYGSDKYPYMAGLIIALTTGEESVCASSVITNTRVLTAAHCWRTQQHEASKITVVLGSTFVFHGGLRIDTSNVIIPNSYKEEYLQNDIAILVFDRVEFNDYIKPIALYRGEEFEVNKDQTVTILGYGRAGLSGTTTNQSLRHIEVQVITRNQCYFVFGEWPISASHICARKNPTSCTGDTGGPLIVNNLLVGISSFTAPDGCERGIAAAYVRMEYWFTWVTLLTT